LEGDFRVGAWLVQPNLNTILDGEREVKLEPKAMEVLAYLAKHSGKVLPKSKIIEEIWTGSFVTEEVLTNSIWELRKALGDDAKNPTYIQTVSRRGYRLIATVTQRPDSGELSVSSLPRNSAFMERHVDAPAPVSELWNTVSFWRAGHVADRATSKGTHRWRIAGLASLAAVVSALVIWLLLGDRFPFPGATPPEPPTAVAIMHFENHIDSEEYAWLSGGIPSMLRSGLAGASGLRVMSSEKVQGVVRQIRGEHGNKELDESFFPEIARRSGARYFLVGSIVKSGPEIRVDTQLEGVSDGRMVAAHTARGTDLLALADELAGEMGRSLELGEPLPKIRAAELAGSLDAYRLYTEGIEARTQLLLGRAERLLLEATSIDPAFAMAHWELHKVALVRHDSVAAEQYLGRALAHRERLPEPHRRLASASELLNRGEQAEAARLLEEILAQHPDEEYAYVLLANMHLASNEVEKGLSVLAGGIQSVPDSGLIRSYYGHGMLRSGRYPEAIRQFESYAQLYPDDDTPYCRLGEAYLVSGMPERALEEYSRAPSTEDTFSASSVGRAWSSAVMGQYDRALEEIDRTLVMPWGPGPYPLMVRSFFLSRVGRYREAQEDMQEGIRLAHQQQDDLFESRAYLLSAMLAIEKEAYAQALTHTDRAIALLPSLSGGARREVLMLSSLFAGIAQARSGGHQAATRHLDSLRALYDRQDPRENWWFHLLRGEIALAQGDEDAAEHAFSEGEPELKIGFSSASLFGSIAANLPFRDGLARTKKVNGDLSGAIRAYRKLLMPDITQRWTGVLEPLHVLELARLLAQQGNMVAAKQQYERFLGLWSAADADSPHLAEARRFLME
jgi:DNA-binding winged helix-turn-helix (wHTH) protein/tetratricopeptide (TPR) repeat protein